MPGFDHIELHFAVAPLHKLAIIEYRLSGTENFPKEAAFITKTFEWFDFYTNDFIIFRNISHGASYNELWFVGYFNI